MHKLMRSAGLTAALWGTSTLVIAAMPPHPLPRAYTNEYGAVVRTESGAPREYSHSDLEAQYLAARHAITPAPQVAPPRAAPTLTPVWQYIDLGTNIGGSNFVISAVGGVPEIIAGGGGAGFGADSFWFILRHNATTGGYDEMFVSPFVSDDAIRRIIAGDYSGTGSPQIMVATQGGHVELWDEATRTMLSQFSSAATQLEGLAVADVDSDGTNDVLITTDSHLYVYTLAGALQWQVTTAGGNDVVAAQMDSDAALEIAVTDGSVIDGSTHTVQWYWDDGFGFDLAAGDIDGDGLSELIAAQAWDYVWAFDVDRKLPKWSIEVFNVGAIGLSDVDGDGVLELMIGEAQWGDELGYNTQTLALQWSLNNPEHGTTAVAAGDVDGDGVDEVIWGAGATSSGPDYMYVGDWRTDTIEWSSTDLDGPFRGPVRGDVDGDGRDEIVAISSESESGYGGGRILVFDGESLALRNVSQEFAGGLSWEGSYDVQLRNVDADRALEIVVGSSYTYDGALEIYDYNGTSFTKSWELNTRPDGVFHSVEVADLDDDGALEVIGGASNYVYVYDYATREEEWHSLYIASAVISVAVADSDGDGALELLALGSDGDLYVFDAASKELEAIVAAEGTCMHAYSIATLASYTCVGTNSGHLRCYEPDAGDYTATIDTTVSTGAVDGFTVGLDRRLWVGSQGTLSWFRRLGQAEIWASAPYGTLFGANVVPSDSTPTRVITAGTWGLVGYELDAQPPGARR